MSRWKSFLFATTAVSWFVLSAKAQGTEEGLLSPTSAELEGVRPLPIDTMPGCRGVKLNGTRSPTSLPPNLQTCRFQLRLTQREMAWFQFTIAAESTGNMTVVINLRAFQGRADMLLFPPNGRIPLGPTMLYSFSGSQEMFIPLFPNEMWPGQYLLGLQAVQYNPLVVITISTTATAVRLAPEDRRALADLEKECCPVNAPTMSSGFCTQVLPILLQPTQGMDPTLDLCHVPPNTCSEQGKLTRLILPGTGLQCGRFPRALSGFRELITLDLMMNQLNDTLAGVGEVVSQLPHLSRLYLTATGLVGEMDCALIQQHAPNLTTLALSSNFLEGTLPLCYTITDKLEELYISRNSLEGELPDFGGQSQLSTLFAMEQMSSGGFSGTIPRSLEQATNLRYLNLDTNSLSGVLPDLPSGIIDIDLGNNLLEGQLWSNIPASVLRVDLHGNQFRSTLPGTMATSWPNVTYVDMDDNQLVGNIPPLPASLLVLHVANNRLGPDLKGVQSGGRRLLDVSEELVQLPKSLVLLSIYNNSFAFDINAVDWSAVWYLYADDNQLTGQLPTNFSSIKALHLSRNQLRGRIDMVAWGDELVELDLSTNRFEGALPASLAKLKDLTYLDVSDNRLSGDLNAFGGALLDTNVLMVMNVSGNQLTGEVPASLAHLGMWNNNTAMMRPLGQPLSRALDLSRNRLSGPYPDFVVPQTRQMMARCQCSFTVITGGGDNRLTCPTPAEVRRLGWSLTDTLSLNDTCVLSSSAKRVLLAYLLEAKEEYVVGGKMPLQAAGAPGSNATPGGRSDSQGGGPDVGVVVAAVVGSTLGALVLVGAGYLGYTKGYLPHRANRFEKYADSNPLGGPPANQQSISMAALPGAMSGRETV